MPLPTSLPPPPPAAPSTLVLRVFVLAAGAPEVFDMLTPPIRLGRVSLNDVAIDHADVGLFHGEIHADGTALRYVDLGAASSLVDGTPAVAGQSIPLRTTSEIRIGAVRIEVVSPPQAPPAADDAEAAPLPFAERVRAPAQTRMLGAAAARRGATSAYRAMAPAPIAHVPATPSGPMLDAPPLRTPAHGEMTVRVPTPPAAFPRATPSGGAHAVTVAASASGPHTATPGPSRTDRFHAIYDALAPAHVVIRRGWASFEAELRTHLASLSPDEQRHLLVYLDQSFAQCGAEPTFRALAATHGAELRSRAALIDVALVRLGELLASVGLSAPLRTATDLDDQLVRIALALDAHAHAFLGLRAAIEILQAEADRARAPAGPRWPLPLERLRTERDLTAYLLAAPRPGEVPSEELRRAYAGQMSGVVVALTGVRRALRRLHAHLAPAPIRDAAAAGLRGGRWRLRLPYVRDALAWRYYVRRHAALAEDGDDWMGAVFTDAPPAVEASTGSLAVLPKRTSP